MNLTVRIPDDLAARLGSDAAALERRALEALALEEYRGGRLTRKELRQALGFETRAELDGFFKAHDINEGVTLAEVERELDTLTLDEINAEIGAYRREKKAAAHESVS